jgi:hypothetical protein
MVSVLDARQALGQFPFMMIVNVGQIGDPGTLPSSGETCVC